VYPFNLLKKSLYFAKLYTLSISMTKQTYKDFLANNGEQKWQNVWYGSDLFHAQDVSDKPKYYTLIEFPYPSGEGLHVGHPRSFTAMDIISRKRRMEVGEDGKKYNVLFPIGFDAFGLPAENFALKTGVHPKITTEKNIANFTRQLKTLGFSFDWSRVVDTTEPGYYKWTQWIFSQLFKHGLAYKKNVAINYCTKDKVALANEEVVNGKCERCGGEVIQKEKDQWMLRITDYADRLDRDLDLVDFWDKIKIQQRNWVGKSEGAMIKFKIQNLKSEIGDESLSVFTTRPDTTYGVTFMAISPELAQKWIDIGWQASSEVEKYIKNELVTRQKTAIELGTEDAKEKTGIDAGVVAINPINGEEVPVWVVNYVLGNVGTGAIMGVPAHDERDYDFAIKYSLSIRHVVIPSLIDTSNPPQAGKQDTTRDMVLAIVYNPRTEKYLTLKWKTQSWTSFVTGGVEADENRVEAAQREIAEETGYINTRLVRSLGMTEAFFFAAHKDVNRKTLGEHFLFELIDDAQVDVASEEKEQYDLQWLSFSELQKTALQHAEAPILLERIITGKDVFIGDGILVNSQEFNGLNVEEGARQIIKKLETIHVGHATSTYKLRDWVFSRQRYWGEPIPLVHCTQCATKKQKVLLIHGFEASGEYAWFPWMKTELEKQGFEVFAPTLPDSKKPSLDAWVSALLEITKDFGEDDIIIGHSLGAQTAMHLLPRMNNKIGQLFLVGNVPLNPTPEQWSVVEKTWVGGRPGLDVLKVFMAQLIDWQAVTEHVGTATIAISRDDYIFGPEVDAFKNIIPAGWRYIVYEDQGHFSDQTEPELLELVSRAKVTGWRLVPELPLALPEVDEFRPGADGGSPLAALEDWINVSCPQCDGPAQRETDTMPQWAGSSWYFLRYIDPKNDEALADPAKLQYWMTQNGERNHDGIDWYNGGMEHTTLHLLYSRFWHKFLYDINVVPTPEPYAKRTSQGMILGEGGVKMSKSLGNVVNPDEIVTEYGADTMRLYEMFMGPFDQAIPWDTKSIIGVRRFLEKVWDYTEVWLTNYQKDVQDNPDNHALYASESLNNDISSLLQQTIQKVSNDIELLQFNTAISALMIFINRIKEEDPSGVLWDRYTPITKVQLEILLKLLSPFAPHIAEELWQQLGHKESISLAPWPIADQSKIITTEITFAVQVNGKVRGTITAAPDASEAEIIAVAQKESNVAKYLDGKEIKKTIVVPGKLVSFVI
jgi:leucyl-tRNA synthetase